MLPTKDKELWADYAQGIKRIKSSPDKKKVVVPKEPKRFKKKEKPEEPPPLSRRPLRQGEILIEARLDLHGMTQEKAHAALKSFVSKQIKEGRRHVLIITGKGKLGSGVLRSSLPHWLEALPTASSLLELRPATSRQGGEGAFTLLLKRKKE